MGCINAAGGWIPPLYIFAGENRKAEWLNDAVDGSVCAMTESSNVNGNVFFNWLQFFIGKIGPARPQVLVMDGHFSHLTQRSVAFAISNKIRLFLLPSHTSHFLQPLDVGVFGHLKKFYATAVSNFPAQKGIGNAALPVRDDIPALTRHPFLNAFTKTNIRTAFFKTGIYPFDVDMMLEKMVGSLSSVHKQKLPYHAALETSGLDLNLSDERKEQLRQHGLDLDALSVVAFHARTVVIPTEQPRPRGTVITPNMTEGMLLTSPGMYEVICKNAELKAMRLEDQESHRLRRVLKRDEAEKAKAAKKKESARALSERHAMRSEDDLAHRIRSICKRETGKRLTEERRRAAQLEKGALRAARKRGKQEVAALQPATQRKRRTLGEITNVVHTKTK